MDSTTPLIWTSKGNLPVESLEYKFGWEESDTATVFWEEHWLDGELVRRAAHVRSKFGVTGEAVANSTGG